jgi:hypothetical protein
VRRFHRKVLVAALFALLSWGAGTGASSAAEDAPVPGSDVLERVPRVLPEGAPLPCEGATPELVRYSGEHLRYQKPLQVHPQFRAHLPAFEQLVRELAERHYGRAPRRIVHLGAYSCRRMRRYPTWVSEHALGNAIDISAFRIGDEWIVVGDGENSVVEEKFLASIRKAACGPFKTVLGPGDPDHSEHLHFDLAPRRNGGTVCE